MAEPEVVLCQNMPIPSTGISFMAGLIPFRHGNPSGPCSTRVEENVNSEKENTRITRRTVPSFPHSFVKFLFSLSLSFSFTHTRYKREHLYPFFALPSRKREFFFGFFFFLSTIIRVVTRIFRRGGSFVKKKLSDDTSELNTFPFSHESPRV